MFSLMAVWSTATISRVLSGRLRFMVVTYERASTSATLARFPGPAASEKSANCVGGQRTVSRPYYSMSVSSHIIISIILSSLAI